MRTYSCSTNASADSRVPPRVFIRDMMLCSLESMLTKCRPLGQNTERFLYSTIDHRRTFMSNARDTVVAMEALCPSSIVLVAGALARAGEISKLVPKSSKPAQNYFAYERRSKSQGHLRLEYADRRAKAAGTESLEITVTTLWPHQSQILSNSTRSRNFVTKYSTVNSRPSTRRQQRGRIWCKYHINVSIWLVQGKLKRLHVRNYERETLLRRRMRQYKNNKGIKKPTISSKQRVPITLNTTKKSDMQN